MSSRARLWALLGRFLFATGLRLAAWVSSFVLTVASARCPAPRLYVSKGLPAVSSAHKKRALQGRDGVRSAGQNTSMSEMPPAVSVIVPVRNEAGNIAPL